jgi:type I restriction enzyme M protein
MSEADGQKFLKDLDKKLWTAADKLRSNLDAAVYKHAVLGLIFLKYVSDAFELRQNEVESQLQNPDQDYYLDPNDYSEDEYEATIREELEVRDYYLEENVFWVPALARWKTIQESAPLANGTEIEIVNGKKTVYKFTSVGKLIDDALDAVEKENPKLKGVLNKNYTQLQLPAESLIGLINLIAEIPFQHEDLDAKDILGHVYEYFLGQFALAEGKKGGQYYTPKSIVNLIVEMLEPFKGRVYDPAMGSGGFFVSSEKFIEQHGGKIGDVSVYGQESNPTTWRLAAMNMAIRGIDFNFGKQPANSFTSDAHPDLRADYVMANPPFNMKEWWDGKLEGDPRWEHGDPPKGNANFGWLQHMLYHLAPKGSMALLLANGSMSSNTKGEGEIRETIVKADLVECMVALPGQLFTNTQIPACIWFLTKTKKKRGRGAAAFRDRPGEVLFIDARKLGYMVDRVLRAFTDEDTEKIVSTFHAWKRGPISSPRPLGGEGQGEGEVGYSDIPGFCKSASLDDIAEHGYVLTPGRYVGAEEVEDDGVPFAEKMEGLTRELATQFHESEKLQSAIRDNMQKLGFALPEVGE